MLKPVASIVTALVNLAALLYIVFSPDTPVWGKALAVLVVFGLHQIHLSRDS